MFSIKRVVTVLSVSGAFAAISNSALASADPGPTPGPLGPAVPPSQPAPPPPPPVYEAPAVSGFDAHGNPIYGDGGGLINPGSNFFGYGVFDIQNGGGLQGAGREYWLIHTYKKH